MNLSIGFNLARFFTKKFILGVCYDFKIFPGFTNQFFSKQFTNDFNANLIPAHGLDSLRSDILYRAVNRIGNYHIRGDEISNYGICFSPFPQKYGGLLIELKKGGPAYPVYGNYPTNSITKDNAPVLINLSNNYSLELSVRPYSFFYHKKSRVLRQKIWQLYKFMICSFYYERFSISKATVNDISINHFLTQDFINKYSGINRFGIKIGIGLY